MASASARILPELRNGVFINPFHAHAGVGEFLKVVWEKKGLPKAPPAEELDRTLPVLPPKWLPETFGGVRVTWLGHACVYAEVEGVAFMTDPIFSMRCSPVQWAGNKRYRNPPCEIEDIPRLDLCLISHDHYDHLDETSVKRLAARFPKLQWYVPLGTKEWFDTLRLPTPVTELTWWASAPFQGERATITAFPSNHWCKRGLFDTNKRLWCSWGLATPSYRVFFAGDTASCPAFTEVGASYGPFDLAAIPIGAYEPRWFMSQHHVDPAGAVEIHQQVRAKRSIGIHWGTFPLTWEPYLEPPMLLKESASKAGLAEDTFFTVHHGDSRIISAPLGVPLSL